MRNRIKLVLINFGIWFYETAGDMQVWDQEDKDNYKKLLDMKKISLEELG